jgi:3-methylcrotonyl-CoA carboxylase beta subunit
MMMLRSRIPMSKVKHFRASFRALSEQKGYVLDGSVPKGPDYNANSAHMKKIVDDFEGIIEKIHQGGGERAQQKLKARNKLFVRDRINNLVDSGSPFLEVGALAGHEMYGKDWLPAAGLVTGVGVVHGCVFDEYC